MSRRMARFGETDDYERSVPDRVLLSRLLSYVTRYKRETGGLAAAIIVSTMINLLPPYMYSLAVDKYIRQLDTRGLYLLGAGFLVVYLLIFVTQMAREYLINWMGSKLELNIRMNMFKHLQRLSLDYYAREEIGSIVSRVTNDVDKITELITSGVANVLADIVTLVGIIGVMIWMDLRLSLITFSIIPLMAAFLYLWGRRARRVYRETRKTIASVSAKMEESMSGIKEIQSYSREKETRLEFQQINRSNMQANVQAGQVMSAFWPAVSVFTALGNFLVLYFGGLAVMRGALSIGVLFGFMGYLGRFFMPIQDISAFWNSVQSALAAAERIFNIMDTPPGIIDRENAADIPPSKGHIEYRDVSFRYEEDTPVLTDINLEIEPNTTVALVGPTGAGKTTMINLLYRFYDPQKGAILVDGYDIRGVKLASLRSQMAVVLQDNFLFSGTVMDNIKYGKPDASDEAVIEVTKTVGAHEFIMKLPEGYNTEVREGGSRLSVGQRQLISLARALLANPRILIMDEATSSIDAYTELIIQEALNKMLENRTSIIIAHRLSTVRNADMIVVLDGGRIVEKGSHSELIQRNGLYKQLYDMQFKYEKKDKE